jgi:hypothetical protein
MAPAVYGIVLAHGLRADPGGRQLWLDRLGELVGAAAGRSSRTAGHLTAAAAFTGARIALHAGQLDAAAAATRGLLTTAEPWYDNPHWYSLRPYAWAIAAEVAVVTGDPGAADRLAAAAPAGRENYWAAACLARAAGRWHADPAALRRSVAGWEAIGARFERACTLLLLPGREAEGAAELRALGCPLPAGTPPRLAGRPAAAALGRSAHS